MIQPQREPKQVARRHPPAAIAATHPIPATGAGYLCGGIDRTESKPVDGARFLLGYHGLRGDCAGTPYRPKPTQYCAIIAAVALVAGVSGCTTDGAPAWTSAPFVGAQPRVTPTVQDPADVQYYPSDEPLRLGQEYFNRGIYGVSERYFRDAVEKAPGDASAWTGLAATYDRIGRFDLADRAYAQAIRLVGETTDILNNLGYSYMLRGNYRTARQKLMQAYKREPDNPTIANNLQLLNGSDRSIQRSPDPRY